MLVDALHFATLLGNQKMNVNGCVRTCNSWRDKLSKSERVSEPSRWRRYEDPSCAWSVAWPVVLG